MFEVWHYNKLSPWKKVKQERKTLRGAHKLAARIREDVADMMRERYATLERLNLKRQFAISIPRSALIVHPGGGKGATMRDLNVRKQNAGMHRLSKMVVPFRIVS